MRTRCSWCTWMHLKFPSREARRLQLATWRSCARWKVLTQWNEQLEAAAGRRSVYDAYPHGCEHLHANLKNQVSCCAERLWWITQSLAQCRWQGRHEHCPPVLSSPPRVIFVWNQFASLVYHGNESFLHRSHRAELSLKLLLSARWQLTKLRFSQR